jgi:hypothetical protein
MLGQQQSRRQIPHLRQTICEKLIKILGEVKSGKVFRKVLWILGEYVESVMRVGRRMGSRRREEGSRGCLRMGRMPLSLRSR